MANDLFHLLLVIAFILPSSSVAQKRGTVDLGSSLTATENNTPWSSPSGDFAFGFRRNSQDKDLFLLAIWYDKIADKTIVWYADESIAVPRGSKVELTAERGIVLSDPKEKVLWSSESILDAVAYGFMNDTGNFVLVSSDSASLWESFKHPTHTILPTQMMEAKGVLYSPQSASNFSRGRFQLRLLEDGNLVLNTRDVLTDLAYDAYYISGTYDPNNSANSGYQLNFSLAGDMFILRRNGQRFNLTPQKLLPFPASDYYHRATLDFNGVFAQYYHPKTLTNQSNWTSIWNVPENICLPRTEKGSGACGYNSVCRIDDNRPICECPQGFTLLDPNNRDGSCKPTFTQSCDEDHSQSSLQNLYDFFELIDTDWPLSDYEQLMPTSEADCRNSCLVDCFCAVAISRGNSCWKKKLPLSNGRKNGSVDGKAFIKYRKGDLSPPPPVPAPGAKKKNRGTMILVGSVLLGSSVFLNFILLGASFTGFFLIYRKKIMKFNPRSGVVETNLRCFSLRELEWATRGFKEELGRGAFGVVYKGVIEMGSSSNIVAVKKLCKVAQQGEKEFRTELNVIGQTHHKNLVRLLGYCDEGENRLLVYEYMSNGCLAKLVFAENKPSWKQRTNIALGIARGLLYLHEECSTQIIHCDIKPQNILLDDYYNARISDFGLAKLLMIDQSRTETAIRGTKGYVALEWFRNTQITAKVDVYSFGVLLLEIISCHRCLMDVKVGEETEKAILTDWAWDCLQEGRLDSLVENDVEALNDMKKLERFVMVGIWCIQEDPSLRPTMRKVCQILEGVVEVSDPPCPYPQLPSSSATV